MYVLDLETTVKIKEVNKEIGSIIDDGKAMANYTFVCATMISKISEKTEDLQAFYGKEESENSILNLKEDTYYTWNGSKFDMFFIYHILVNNGYEETKSENVKTFKKKTFFYTMSNNKIIKLIYRNQNGIINIRDACLLFTCSLASFIKNTCPEKPKLENTYDYLKYREFSEDFSNDDKLYCVADVEGFAIGLHRISEKFKEKFGIDILESLTAGSFAMKFASTKIDTSMFSTTNNFPQGHIIGGRTWVNPEHQGEIIEDLTKIDANSFYAYIMANTKLPYGNQVICYDTAEGLIERIKLFPELYFFAELHKGTAEYGTVGEDLKYNKFSPICISDDDGNRVYTNYGTDQDNIYLDDNILRDPNLKLTGTLRIFSYKAKTGIFNYMPELFDLKNKFKLEKNFALELAVKVILVSTYGKFLQKTEVEKQEIKDNKTVKTGKTKSLKTWYTFNPMGAAITANARHILCTFMNLLGNRFCYCDTDSLIFSGDIPKEIPIGLNLGQWKVENSIKNGKIIKERGIFFGKKTYAMQKEENTIITFCGIGSNAIQKKYPVSPSLEDLKKDMRDGISFDILNSEMVENGVMLLEKIRTKKYINNFGM